MAGRSVDVSLRIKAQDEASKALDTVAKALKDLQGAQGALAGGSSGVGKFVEDLSKNIDSLSTVFGKLEQQIERSDNAYKNQALQIAAVSKSIEERKRRILDLSKAEADLQRIQGTYKNVSTAKQTTFVGPVPPKIKSVQSQISSETGFLGKEEANLTAIISKMSDYRSATLELKNAQAPLATALGATKAEYDRQAEALDRLTAAEKRAAAEAVQRRQNASVATTVNANTGVNQTGTPSSLRNIRQADLEKTFAPVFTAEDVATAKAEAAAIREAGEAFNAFEARAKQGAAAMASIQQYARDVAEALDPVARVTRLVAEEEARLAEAVKLGALSRSQADAALARHKALLDGTSAATGREARELDNLSTYVQELRRDFDQAGYAERFLANETEKLNRALKAGILNTNEYGKALEVVKRKAEQLGEKQSPKVLGLNPYQTQNLMFQVNDVVTQLASGTSITQTLAQQGGQILQLFPKVGNAIVGAFSVGGAAIAGFIAVAIAPLIIGIKQAFDEVGRLRDLGATIEGAFNSTGATAKGLDDTVTVLKRYGIAAAEATAITKSMFRDGFDTSQIRYFATLAKDMSDVLGIDLKQSLDLLKGAYTGNYDALEKLMDATDALSPSQRQMIKDQYDTGDAAGATARALDIVSGKMSDAANKSKSEWSKAIMALSNAWDGLAKQLANTWWAKAAVEAINGVADALNYLSGESDRARVAEERRTAMGTGAPGNGVTSGADDPLNGFYGVAPGKTDRQDRSTPDQQATYEKEKQAAEDRARAEGKITSEKDIQARLAIISRQEYERLGNSVSAAQANEIVSLRVAGERVKLEEQLTQYKKQQAAEEKRIANQQNTAMFQAKALLRNKEGFISSAKWDVNHYRVGYGSDTYVGNDGVQRKTQADTVVTRAQAERDLEMRIDDVINAIKQKITAKRFEQFSAQQQAALVSVYYNYGVDSKRLKEALEPVLKTGTDKEIADVFRQLANDKPYSKNGVPVNYNRRMAEAKMIGIGNVAVAEGAAQVKEDEGAKLEKYNETLDEKLRREERSIENQKALVGLQGEALRAEIERQQIAEQIAQATDDLRRTTGNDTATLSQDQVDRITVDVKARLKLEEPAKVAADLQKQVDDLQGYRSTLEAKLQVAQQTGDTGGMENIKRQIEDIDARIAQAAKSYLEFLNTPGNADALGLYGVALDNMIAKMTQLSEKTAEWQLNIGGATISATEFANAFTGAATNALDQFAQAVAGGANVFKSLWTAFRQFAADFLLQIAKMIQQQIIFNLVSSLLKGLGGAAAPSAALSGSASATIAANPSIFHDGGIVGGPAPFRSVSPSLFSNAMRYHSGGIAGLKPGEVPSILMQGEEVLTRDDPRHMMNGGGGRGDVKIVNTFDESDFFSKGANTKAGEKAILNLVRSNPRAFKAAMGGG